MPRTYTGKLVSKGELAEIMGVALPTVDHWIKRGAPFVSEGGKGVAWVLNTADVIEWRLDEIRGEYEDQEADEKVLDYNEARRRRTAAEAELAELELYQKRGLVVSIDTVEKEITTLLATVKAQINAIPHSNAHLLAKMRGVRQIEKHLTEKINEALNELSLYDPTSLPASVDGEF
jgi:phage terminase Nu1 subunit (DNA packaging protein)